MFTHKLKIIKNWFMEFHKIIFSKGRTTARWLSYKPFDQRGLKCQLALGMASSLFPQFFN
jgi:hypothetical protein